MRTVNRIIYNTSIQYLRLLFTVGLALYSTRFILRALGDIDYGIYSLLAGIVILLSFVNAAMTVTTQRYLSVSQGSGDLLQQHRVFINSLILHLGLGIFIIIVVEIGGLFLFNGFLNIPEDRVFDAYCVYHFIGITIFFTILSAPFIASLTAHENMLWVSIVYIVESFSKFLISVLLMYFFESKLIVYGVLIALVSIICFCLFAFYCIRKYAECSIIFSNYWDRATMKSLTSFAGWNLLNVLTLLGETQGLAILLNKFLGPSINAAYGIANQVSSQLNYISQSLLNAVNPQIMRSEGMCNRDKMLHLSILTSKYSFFLLAVFAVPCIFEMPLILKIWLGYIPSYTVIFCRWMLVAALLNQLTAGLASANQAIGKIKTYMLTTCTVRLLIIPISFFVLKLGYSVSCLFVIYAFLVGLASMARIYLTKKMLNLDVGKFCKEVPLRIFIPLTLSIVGCYYITLFDCGEYRFLFTILFSGLISITSIYWLGMNKEERMFFNQLYANIYSCLINNCKEREK